MFVETMEHAAMPVKIAQRPTEFPTKAEFIAAAKKGWETIPFDGKSWNGCAFTAAAKTFEMSVWKLRDLREDHRPYLDISRAVYDCRNKEEAIAALEALDWE